MRNLFLVSCVTFVIFIYETIVETSSQAITPIGYGSPTVYSQNDDDLGMLLTILLLAGRNRNSAGRYGQSCQCCNCCNCGDNSQNIPIPYPIPFPTNNPIINRAHKFYDEYDDDDEDDSDNSNEELNKTVLKGDKEKSGTGNAATIVQEVEVEQEAEGESDDAKSKSN